MKIRKFHPSPFLYPMVREFVIIETVPAIESHIIPHTSLVLSFRYKGRVEGLPGASVAGIRKTAHSFRYAGDTANFLVIFREGGFATFSRTPAHELFGLTVSAEDLLPASLAREIPERLASASDDYERISIVEAALRRQLIPERSDSLVNESLAVIVQSNGLIRIRDLAEQLHVSQDSLEKRFRKQTGATPKQIGSIVRLRTLVQQYKSADSLTKLAFAAGYFDQSHFIRDFRSFTGRSPKDFLQSFRNRFW